MTILVLTRPNDGTAGGVTAELERRGMTVTRCDVGDFPLNITMTASLADHQSWSGSLTVAGKSVALDEIRAIYVAITAHLFQEQVPKKFDLRLTVVGDQFFAVAIHANSDKAYADWRSDYGALNYDPIKTPDDVRCSVLAMLKQFDLPFGAFDFTITPEGEWVFLEINPNGQWGWIEESTGLPITSAVADLLTDEAVA